MTKDNQDNNHDQNNSILPDDLIEELADRLTNSEFEPDWVYKDTNQKQDHTQNPNPIRDQNVDSFLEEHDLIGFDELREELNLEEFDPVSAQYAKHYQSPDLDPENDFLFQLKLPVQLNLTLRGAIPHNHIQNQEDMQEQVDPLVQDVYELQDMIRETLELIHDLYGYNIHYKFEDVFMTQLEYDPDKKDTDEDSGEQEDSDEEDNQGNGEQDNKE